MSSSVHTSYLRAFLVHVRCVLRALLSSLASSVLAAISHSFESEVFPGCLPERGCVALRVYSCCRSSDGL
jgi:hypothetical protein